MARGLLEREILLPGIFRQDVKPFPGAVPELRAPSSSAGMEAEVLRAGVEELGPGTGGLQPRAQGLTSARPGSGGKHGFGSKTRSGRRGSSCSRLRGAEQRWSAGAAGGSAPWGGSRRAPSAPVRAEPTAAPSRCVNSFTERKHRELKIPLSQKKKTEQEGRTRNQGPRH